jgi:hypothetical protein
MTYRVIPMSSGEYEVTVEVPVGVRSHRIVVGPQLLGDLGADHERGEQVVAAALDYLDDAQELRTLPAYVDLDAYRVRRGFVAEVRRRIS